MTPMEARLQCLRLAVDTQGNPNKLQLAQGYYEFVNTPEPAPQRIIEQPRGKQK